MNFLSIFSISHTSSSPSPPPPFIRISYAFGMGGLEKTAYDSKEKIFYGVSEQGIVSENQ